jgi:hypothetical protein
MWWNSFSEVEQTRSVLEALCLRAIAESRVAYLRVRNGPPPLTTSSRDAHDRALAQRLARLDELAEEFHGTEQFFLIHSERFRVLERAGRDGEWLDAYLGIFYQHPTHPMVSFYLDKAETKARAIGREGEIALARSFRRQIPADQWPAVRKAPPTASRKPMLAHTPVGGLE